MQAESGHKHPRSGGAKKRRAAACALAQLLALAAEHWRRTPDAGRQEVRRGS